MNSAYNKAVIALLGFIVAVASAFGFTLDFLTPELQATIASGITAVLVYLIPNKTPPAPPAA